LDNTKPLSRKLQVLFLSIGKFLTTIAALVSSILLSRLLSIDEYANYRQVILVYALINPILALGFDRSMYYNFEKNKDNHGEQILNVQYIVLSIAILFSVFFMVGGAGLISQLFNNSNIEKGIIIYSIFAIVNLPVLLLQPVLVLNKKIKLLTTFNILNKIFSVLVTVLIAFFYRDANSILISLLFVGLVTFVVVQIILLKNSSKVNSFKYDHSIIKDYSKIGLPLLIASMMGIAGKNIDKLLISTMMTPADFAVYTNGAIEIPMIGAITGAVMVVILADFTKLLNQGKVKETFELWGKAVETTSSILIPLMFLLLLNADWLIVAMYGEKYIDSVIPFKIYLLLLPIRTMTFSSLITASGKTKIISKGALLFLISNVILSVIFIKILGFSGPAIATVLTTYLLGIFYSINISKVNKVSFFKVFVLRTQIIYFIVGCIALFFSIISYNLLNMDLIFKIIISNLLFIMIISIGSLAFGKKKQYFELISILKK